MAEVIILRNATLEDVPAILEIYGPYVSTSTVSSEYDVPSVAEMSYRMRTYTQKTPWLVVTIDGKVAGYGYASPHKGRAGYQWSTETSIYVHHDYQRRGIARAIYLALFEILAMQGYYNIFVGIVSPNEKSLAFHESLGFEINGRYHKSCYKFGEWRDVTWMRKNIRELELEPIPPIPYTELIGVKRYQDLLDEAAANIHLPRPSKK